MKKISGSITLNARTQLGSGPMPRAEAHGTLSLKSFPLIQGLSEPHQKTHFKLGAVAHA